MPIEGGGQIRSESGGYTFYRNLVLGPGGGSLDVGAWIQFFDRSAISGPVSVRRARRILSLTPIVEGTARNRTPTSSLQFLTCDKDSSPSIDRNPLHAAVATLKASMAVGSGVGVPTGRGGNRAAQAEAEITNNE